MIKFDPNITLSFSYFVEKLITETKLEGVQNDKKEMKKQKIIAIVF